MSSRGPLTSPGTLVLLRHGQSTWNLENLFTGWHDVPLSELGVAEAKEAGRLMHAAGLAPAIVHTSVLVRAIQTSDLALAEMNRTWIQVRRSWRLNERHYGALQGLNKRQTAERFGEDKVKVWRRSYDVRPPALEAHAIVPDLLREECVLVSAHGNSLRALVKHLDGLTDQQVVDLDIPTGVPRVYELDPDFKPRSSRYLGDPKEIERRAAAVRNQASGSKSPSR